MKCERLELLFFWMFHIKGIQFFIIKMKLLRKLMRYKAHDLISSSFSQSPVTAKHFSHASTMPRVDRDRKKKERENTSKQLRSP